MENTAPKRIPTHISIIMDGNGRWAKQRGLDRLRGHAEGAESVRVIGKAARKAGVKYLSLYAFSEENWLRPEAEVAGLMDLLLYMIKTETKNLIEDDIRLLVLGNRSRLSADINKAIDGAEQATAHCKAVTLIVFFSYSGQWDILQAVRKISAEGKDASAMTADEFSSYLVTAGIPDPDLLIRTSGEQRISNYLLWQCAYSEFYFTPVLWPDFRENELLEAIEEYGRRDRRYGKVK